VSCYSAPSQDGALHSLLRLVWQIKSNILFHQLNKFLQICQQDLSACNNPSIWYGTGGEQSREITQKCSHNANQPCACTQFEHTLTSKVVWAKGLLEVGRQHVSLRGVRVVRSCCLCPVPVCLWQCTHQRSTSIPSPKPLNRGWSWAHGSPEASGGW